MARTYTDNADGMDFDHRALPETVVASYGELTRESFQKVLDELLNKFGFKLDETKTFLDIGSGYGKPVLHTYLTTGARCTGIEAVERRVLGSRWLLELTSRYVFLPITIRSHCIVA